MTLLKLGHLRAALPFAAVAALAGCVPPPASPPPSPTPTPAPAPPPSPAPVPPPPSHTNWLDAPQTPGDWFYQPSATGGAARFGAPQSEARFSMVCDRTTRTVSLVRSGNSPVAVQMRIRTETGDRVLDAAPSGGQLPTLTATLAANDPFLDAMALSRGRFAIEIHGVEALYLPAWPEITRVIEDCR